MEMLFNKLDVLKENSRISKEALNKLITGSLKEIMPTQKIKMITNCDNCPYRGLPKEQFQDKCTDSCEFKNISEVVDIQEISEITKTIINPNSNNEIIVKMPYVVYKSKNTLFSKTAIKQYLLYNFFNVNKYYIIKNISLKYISDLMGVSLATIKRNNEILQELNLIHVTYTGFNMYDISVIGKNKLHATEEEGGKGYLTISKEFLFHLLNISNVNSLKIELKKMLISDYTANIYKDRKITDISISSFKNVLPFYLKKGRKAIKEVLTQNNSLFKVTNINFERNVFELNISKYETKDKLKMKLEERISSDLTSFLESINFNLVSKKEVIIRDYIETTEILISQFENEKIESNCEKDTFKSRLKDLIGLSIEYGAQVIKNALIYIKRRYIIEEGISINNIGGFIRRFLTNLININGSYLII